MSKPKPAPLPSGTVVGGYQIVKKLAAGGFGVVYLAEDDKQHLVAIKEYLPGWGWRVSSEGAARWRRFRTPAWSRC